MKKVLFVMLSAALISCGQSGTTPAASTEATAGQEQYFGEKITPDDAIPVDELAAKMGESDSMQVKITGVVSDVCQKKGCWMELKTAYGNGIRVTFKDYGFFMPKDCQGKTIIAEGFAKVEETSVADLQEYAKDAGQSDAEVAAITAPKKELVYEASGVILK